MGRSGTLTSTLSLTPNVELDGDVEVAPTVDRG